MLEPGWPAASSRWVRACASHDFPATLATVFPQLGHPPMPEPSHSSTRGMSSLALLRFCVPVAPLRTAVRLREAVVGQRQSRRRAPAQAKASQQARQPSSQRRPLERWSPARRASPKALPRVRRILLVSLLSSV